MTGLEPAIPRSEVWCLSIRPHTLSAMTNYNYIKISFSRQDENWCVHHGMAVDIHKVNVPFSGLTSLKNQETVLSKRIQAEDGEDNICIKKIERDFH